jgi:hypothetical protein
MRSPSTQFQTIVAQQGFGTLLYRKQKNTKKYISSLNQPLTDGKRMKDNKDKDCSDVMANLKNNNGLLKCKISL